MIPGNIRTSYNYDVVFSLNVIKGYQDEKVKPQGFEKATELQTGHQ